MGGRDAAFLAAFEADQIVILFCRPTLDRTCMQLSKSLDELPEFPDHLQTRVQWLDLFLG